MTQEESRARLEAARDLAQNAPRWVKTLIAIAFAAPFISVPATLVNVFTIPSRLTAVEQQVARSDSARQTDNSYLRGEINAIVSQIDYFLCLDERIDDPARRETCEEIRTRVQRQLEARARLR